MDGWMDRQRGRQKQTDGWMDAWIGLDGWMDRLDGWIQTDRRVDGKMDS